MSTQMVPIQSPERPPDTNTKSISPARFVCFGPFHLDLKKEELFKDGTRVKLQGKVHHALVALLQRPGEIVTREELRLQLWPEGTYVNYDANVNTTVNKLRQVLGDSTDQPVFVETIPRKGYSFVGKVVFVDQLPAQVTAARSEAAPAEPALAAESPRASTSLLQRLLLSRGFTAGVITLVITSMLLGAALVLYAHR